MGNGVIFTKTDRPDAKLVEQYKDVPTAIASDAMNRTNAVHAEIKALTPGASMVGSAVTVKAMVGCNIMSHQAVYIAQPGDVIVFDARGHKDTSVWGYLQTRACIMRGIAGVVIDGSIRDSREIRKSGFPVFCRGVTPAGPHKGWGDSINVPIQCGGVHVCPGDIVLGDDDGVVVIPRPQAEQVLENVKAELVKERGWFAALEEGKTTVEILGLDSEMKRLGVTAR